MNKCIDVHHHIIPPFYVEALKKEFGVNSEGNVLLPQWGQVGVKFPEWSWEISDKAMDEHNITSALTSISTPGMYFKNTKTAQKIARQCNEYAAAMSSAQPLKYGAFASLPLPYIDASLEEMRYALDTLEMNGLILLSNYDNMLLGNKLFEPLFEELNNKKTTVFIHPTAPSACTTEMSHIPQTMFEFVCDSSRTVIHLLTAGIFEKYSNINFIIAHAGGVLPFLAGRMELYNNFLSPSTFSNAPKGVDYYLKRLYYDTAMSTSAAQLRCLLEYVSVEQVLLGTDFPFVSQAGISKVLDRLKHTDFITSEQRELICHKNALQLFSKNFQ